MPVIQSAIKSILIKTQTELVVNLLCLQFPFLKLPIINQIFTFFVNKGVSVLVEQGELALYIAHLEKLKSDQAQALKDSIKEHEEAKTDEERERAYRKVIDDFRRLGKLTVPSKLSN